MAYGGAGAGVGALAGPVPTGGTRAAVGREVPNSGGRTRRPKRRLPPEVLTDEEVRALLGACGSWTPTGLRNRALIALLYRAGLRISEALALCPKDVDLRAGTVRVLHGKGDFDRTVGLDDGACAVVGRWALERARWGAGPAKPLLCSRAGNPVSTGYVRRLMRRLARAAGIDKRVHAHGLRHTHAAQLRSEGVDVGIISKQLGHRSILTTIRYLDHINPTRVVEAVRAREWRVSICRLALTAAGGTVSSAVEVSMNEKQAKAVATALGGDPWQSGGGIWVVVIRRTDGRLVVISGDAVCEYEDESSFDRSEASTSVLFKV